MKYKAIRKIIEQDGWFWKRTRGSHDIYHHPAKPGIVVLASHGDNTDIPPGLHNKILKEAGLK